MVLSHHFRVDALLSLQVGGTSELDQLALLHDHDLVGVLQGRQPVGDGQHRALFELLGDDPLDEGVVPDVDVGGGLVDEDHPAVLEEGPADAEQLLLPRREAAVGDRRLQPPLLLDHLPEVALPQDCLELPICVAVGQIQILLKGGFDEGGILVDHGHRLPQSLKGQLLNISPINNNFPS